MVIRILAKNVEHTNNGKLKLEGYVVSVVDLKLSKTCQDSEFSYVTADFEIIVT